MKNFFGLFFLAVVIIISFIGKSHYILAKTFFMFLAILFFAVCILILGVNFLCACRKRRALLCKGVFASL